MRLHDSIDVVGTRNLQCVVILCDVDTIEISHGAKVLERWVELIRALESSANAPVVDLLGKSFIRACKCEVVDLAKKQDRDIVNGGTIDASVMDGGLEVEFSGQDLVDVRFPQAASFGVSLKCAQYR